MSAWNEKGPTFTAGLDGADGADGADGLSAYEVAVQQGFVGSINDWILSLQGKSAYALAVQEGFVGSLNDWILSLQGADATLQDLDFLTDVEITAPVDQQVLTYDEGLGLWINSDGAGEQLLGKTDMTGFPVDLSGNYLCTLTYNETTRTVTLTPTGASFDVFCNGVRYNFVGPQSIVHSAVGANQFVYFNESGILTTGTTPWDLLKHACVCFVFQDETNSLRIPFEERHHAGADKYWHRNQHAAEGTKATGTGFGLSGYALNSSVAANLTYSIASGRVEDEDIRVDTEVVPDGGPYAILSRIGAAGAWQLSRTSTVPMLRSGTALQYNLDTAGTWSLANVGNGNFCNYYIYGCTALPQASISPAPGAVQQYVIVPGQAVYGTESLASAELFTSLNWGTLPFQEIVPLYQITIGQYSASGGTQQIRRVVRIVGTAASISAAATTDHGSLSGLTDPDHPASAIVFTPTGNLVATDAQAAIAEVDAEKAGVALANTFTANQVIQVTDNINAALRVTQLGTGLVLLIEDAANPDSSPFAVDAAGCAISGNTTALACGTLGSAFNKLQVIGTGLVGASISRFSNDALNSYVTFAKSRGTLPGTLGAVVSGDGLGIIEWAGDDGTDVASIAASISASVDGTPGANDMPGRLVFSTTADGASSPTERMRITSAGLVGIGGIPTALFQVNGAGSSLENLRISSTSDGTQQTVSIGLSPALPSSVYPSASVAALEFDTGDFRASLIFSTRGSNSDVAPTERMRIDETGLVTITGIQEVVANSASPALIVTQTGSGHALLVEDSANPDSTPFLINTSGQVSIGSLVTDNFPLSSSTLGGPRLQQVGTAQADASISAATFSVTATVAPNVILAHSRGALNAQGLVSNGDALGRFVFEGSDGQAVGTNTGWLRGAVIEAAVDGTAAAGSMPGRLVLSTTPDGSPTPVERLRIDNAGNVLVKSAAGLGYGSGAGGTVTQATSKSTSVTLNKPCGRITTDAAALAAGATVIFTLSNSLIDSTDGVQISRQSGGTAGAYQVWCESIANGSCTIAIRNNTAGSLSESILLSFVLLKAVTS